MFSKIEAICRITLKLKSVYNAWTGRDTDSTIGKLVMAKYRTLQKTIVVNFKYP